MASETPEQAAERYAAECVQDGLDLGVESELTQIIGEMVRAAVAAALRERDAETAAVMKVRDDYDRQANEWHDRAGQLEAERDRLRDALESIKAECSMAGADSAVLYGLARAALEGTPTKEGKR